MAAVFGGIDVGTQGARCVFVTDDGQLVSEGSSVFGPGLAIHRAGAPVPEAEEGHEQDEQEPGTWTAAVKRAVSQAVASARQAGRPLRKVRAVGVTSTSGTVCCLDARGRPVSAAIMYNDPRCAAEAREAQKAGADVAERLGYRVKTSFALPKIMWVRRHRPAVFAQTAFLTSPTDYIIGWLTDRWGRTDQNNALKWGYDLIEKRWPPFITGGLGLPASLLPEVQRPGEEVGKLLRRRADELGLPHGTPVVAGTTDGCADQVASGAAAPGEYNTSLGTTMIVKGVSDRLILDPEGRVYCHRHPDGWWLPGGASNTGAGCLNTEFSAEEIQEMTPGVLQHSPTGLLCYPLVGKGERFPFVDAEAEGFVLGSPRSREELFAGYLEGVSYLERLAFETLGDLGARIGDTVYSVGGGSLNDGWLQIRADVLNRTVRRPALPGAAMGAAVIAASRTRHSGLTEAARAMVRVDREVVPRPAQVPVYEDKYQQWREQCVERGYIAR